MKSQITSGRVALAASLFAVVAALGGTAVATAGSDGSESAASVGKVITKMAVVEGVTDADGTTNGGDVGIAAKSVTCPAGTKVIGGGAKFINGNTSENVYLQASTKRKNGWAARGIVDFGAQGTVDFAVFAYCAK